MLKELTGVPAGIQGLETSGTVTADDYERVFAPLVEQARRAGSRMRLLYRFGSGFERITIGGVIEEQLHIGLIRPHRGMGEVTHTPQARSSAPAALGANPSERQSERRPDPGPPHRPADTPTGPSSRPPDLLNDCIFCIPNANPAIRRVGSSKMPA